MSDRFTKIVLTVIATALVYLCVVLTPLPSAHAQTAARPGDPTGPGTVEEYFTTSAMSQPALRV